MPAKEGRRVEREKLKERGEPTLEREVLERIGEVMTSKGVEMTRKRRKEMEKNLKGKRVVKWGDDVEGVEKEKAELEEEEEEEEEEEWDDEEEWEEVPEASTEDDNPRDEKRPTL